MKRQFSLLSAIKRTVRQDVKEKAEGVPVGNRKVSPEMPGAVTEDVGPALPAEVASFTEVDNINRGTRLTADDWLSGLRSVQIKDVKQQISLRPWFALAVYLLLLGQNIGIGIFVWYALKNKELAELQLIFSTLVAATLTQSYFILRLITKKIFDNIDYAQNNTKNS